jgi:hypothetical protein
MDPVSSALSVVLDDAEKIADSLVPPGSSVEKTLGVLIKQVEKIAGGKIAALTDKELGIATAEQEQEAAAEKQPAPTAPIPPAVPTGAGATAESASVIDAAQTKAERIAAIKAQYDKEIAEAEAS